MLPSKATFVSCEAYLNESGSRGFAVGRIHFTEEWGWRAYESESNFILQPHHPSGWQELPEHHFALLRKSGFRCNLQVEPTKQCDL